MIAPLGPNPGRIDVHWILSSNRIEIFVLFFLILWYLQWCWNWVLCSKTAVCDKRPVWSPLWVHPTPYQHESKYHTKSYVYLCFFMFMFFFELNWIEFPSFLFPPPSSLPTLSLSLSYHSYFELEKVSLASGNNLEDLFISMSKATRRPHVWLTFLLPEFANESVTSPCFLGFSSSFCLLNIPIIIIVSWTWFK